jgi:hypothetical protein
LSHAEAAGLEARLRSVWLRQSLAEYVCEGFLPQVWVDLRARCDGVGCGVLSVLLSGMRLLFQRLLPLSCA